MPEPESQQPQPVFAIVNAFSNSIGKGNTAAVVISEAPLAEAVMPILGRDFNMPATAFVSGTGLTRQIRWFTSSVELALCGHGALAAAHVLREIGMASDGSEVVFTRGNTRLSVSINGKLLLLKIAAASLAPTGAIPGLEAALGQTAVSTMRGALDIVVELANADAVWSLRPDFEALKRIETRGVIATARAGGDCDYVLRFFAPRQGLNEDAVTGTAHAAVAPMWAQRLRRDELLGRQLSARGGEVGLRVSGDVVELAGEAVTIASGFLSKAAVE